MNDREDHPLPAAESAADESSSSPSTYLATEGDTKKKVTEEDEEDPARFLSDEEWREKFGPISFEDLPTPELREIFEAAKDLISRDLRDGIPPPDHLAYRPPVSDRGDTSAGTGRYLDDFVQDILDAADLRLQMIKDLVLKYPIVSRVVNKQEELGFLLGKAVIAQSRWRHLYSDPRIRNLSFSEDVVQILVEQNPHLLHCHFEFSRDGDLVLDILHMCEFESVQYWVGKNHPWAYCQVPPGRVGLPHCPHDVLIYGAMEHGDLDFVKRFYSHDYPIPISAIKMSDEYDDEDEGTLLHCCALILPLFLIAVEKSFEIFKWLVEQYPEALYVKDLDGYLPLHLLCQGATNIRTCALENFGVDGLSGLDLSHVLRYLGRTFPKAFNVSKADGFTPLTELCNDLAMKCGNLPSQMGKIERLSSLINILMIACPSTIRARDDDGRLPLDALLVLGAKHPVVQDLCIHMMRCMYPNLPAQYNYPFVSDIRPLMEDEAKYGEMSIRLQRVTAMIDKYQQEDHPSANNDGSDDRIWKDKAYSAYQLDMTTKLMELDETIQSIREVDIPNVKQQHLDDGRSS